MVDSPLAGRHRDPVFNSLSTPTVIIDEGLVIRAATPSYREMTERVEDELVGVHVFDAFPPNPHGGGTDTGDLLLGCLESGLRRSRGDEVVQLRYDIPDARRPGQFLARSWVLVTTPIRDDGRALGVLVRVRDESSTGVRLAAVLDGYARALEQGSAAPSATGELGDLLASLEDYDVMAEEVRHLRRALASRPVIDQAKGIVMAEQRCDADEAFRVLSRLSQDSNVRVAEVAAAIVYQASRRS